MKRTRYIFTSMGRYVFRLGNMNVPVDVPSQFIYLLCSALQLCVHDDS